MRVRCPLCGLERNWPKSDLTGYCWDAPLAESHDPQEVQMVPVAIEGGAK